MTIVNNEIKNDSMAFADTPSYNGLDSSRDFRAPFYFLPDCSIKSLLYVSYMISVYDYTECAVVVWALRLWDNFYW